MPLRSQTFNINIIYFINTFAIIKNNNNKCVLIPVRLSIPRASTRTFSFRPFLFIYIYQLYYINYINQLSGLRLIYYYCMSRLDTFTTSIYVEDNL